MDYQRDACTQDRQNEARWLRVLTTRQLIAYLREVASLTGDGLLREQAMGMCQLIREEIIRREQFD